MKPEVVFGLENAAWPALLLDAGSVVLRANAAAVSTFGSALAGEAPALSAIWSPENGATPEHFFARWEHSPAATVATRNFASRAAATATFTAVDLRLQPRRGEMVSFFNCCPPEIARRRARPMKPGRAGHQRRGAQTKTGLRAATGADGVAGFQQRADERARPHVAAVEQGRAGASVAAFADGGGEIRGARGGNRQRTRSFQPPGKGNAAARRRAT